MIALVFAGQGSEVPCMGKDFYDAFDEIKELYLYAEELTGLPLREVAFGDDDLRLHETLYAQILLFLYDVFVVDLLRKKNLAVDVTFGLSLGEYGALYQSGVFDQKTGLEMIMKRAKFMSEACDELQGMAAIIGLEEEKLRLLLHQDSVFLANFNTPNQLVISGLKDAVEEVCKQAMNAGAKRTVMLPSSGAFHTPFMVQASVRFGEYLKSVTLNKPLIPVLLNTTGKCYQKDLKSEMEKQIVSSVYFYQSVEEAMKIGVDTFIEVAPKSVVKSMIKKVNRKVKVYTISSVEDINMVFDLV